MEFLSNRSKNGLKLIFEKDNIHISDVVDLIVMNGNYKMPTQYKNYNILIMYRNIGKKSYDEIMRYVSPFL